MKRIILSFLICTLSLSGAFAGVNSPDNSIDHDNCSDAVFTLVCGYGTLQEVNDAIKNGGNVNAAIAGGTPLISAAMFNKNPEVINALVKAGADVNARGKRGYTALSWAARGNIVEVVEALIMAGADVNARSDEGDTPLLIATFQGESKYDAILALINAGADVNVWGKDGYTPLMWASMRKSDPKVIKALIKAGADVNAKEKERGDTPLMIAITNFSPNPDEILTLLELGADPKIKNDSGKMAIDLAKGNMKLWNTEALRKLEEASK